MAGKEKTFSGNDQLDVTCIKSIVKLEHTEAPIIHRLIRVINNVPKQFI